MASTRSFRRARRRSTLVPHRSPDLRGPVKPGSLAAVGIAAVAASALAVPLLPVGSAGAALPTGAGVVLNAPIVGVAALPQGGGYWEVGADGGVFAFGGAQFYGSTGSIQLNKPIVGVQAAPDGRGYWEVASDGGVFAFGDAKFYGSTGSVPLNQPIVGIDSTPDGAGYWIVAADGGVFTFGDAQFYGSATGQSPTSPIVGIATTPDGRGYWETASDGDVYAFGDARYAGGAPVGGPVVGISPGPSGYRLTTAAGGIDDFGGAQFYGSTGGHPLNEPVIGMSTTTTGYVTVASDGGIFSFGGAGFYGSLGGSTIAAPSSRAVGIGVDGLTAYQIAAWTRVNVCEEGGQWNVDGSVYSGGLGMSRANWDQFNTFGYPADAAAAAPDEQIRVAVAFATSYWGNPNAAPDQDGCTGGY
jgi:hypothetical protein